MALPVHARPFLSIVVLLLFVAGCGGDSGKKLPPRKQPRHLGLFQPITVTTSGTTVDLKDYFPMGDWPDTVRVGEGIDLRQDSAAGTIALRAGAGTPWLSTLDLSFGKWKYSILVQKEGNRGAEAPQLFAESFADGRLQLGGPRDKPRCIALWNNQRIAASANADQQSYSLRLPPAAAEQAHSWLRVWAYGPAGYTNEVLVPLAKGKPVRKVGDLAPDDPRRDIVYSLTVDRFHNGNRANDPAPPEIDIPRRLTFRGGDLAGVTQQLRNGFFEDFAISRIWLSPIAENPDTTHFFEGDTNRLSMAWHGRWPKSDDQVDPRFGNNAALLELVDEAHERSIKLDLQVVPATVHGGHPLVKAHRSWLRIGPDSVMYAVRMRDQAAADHRVTAALHWAKRFKLDGYAQPGPVFAPANWWRRLRQRLHAEISLPGKRAADRVQTQIDRNLYEAAGEFFSAPDSVPAALQRALSRSLARYGHHHTAGNMTGTAEQARFISYAGKALARDEDPVAAGWSRDISGLDASGYFKRIQFTAFISAIPGTPVLFYGDEIGTPGAAAPDNQRKMRFVNLDTLENLVYQHTRRLLQLRRSSMPALYGETVMLKSAPGSLVLMRKYFDEAQIYVFNLLREPQNIIIGEDEAWDFGQLKPVFGLDWRQASARRGEIQLAPFGIEVLVPRAR